MIDIAHDAAKDDVLFAFQLAHPRPGPRDIAEWIRRHPAFESDILEHATLLLEINHDSEEEAVADEALLARGRSRMLNAIYVDAEGAKAKGDLSPRSFEGLLKASGKSLPDVAREIDIGRGVLTDLVSGRMAPPIGRRLVDALVSAFSAAAAEIHAAFEASLAAPLMGRAKASGTPAALRRPYAEIVMADPTMSDERKAYWLED